MQEKMIKLWYNMGIINRLLTWYEWAALRPASMALELWCLSVAMEGWVIYTEHLSQLYTKGWHTKCGINMIYDCGDMSFIF